MDFQQALQLATDIHAGSKAELISVGRFLPLGELQPSSPWGCSVLVHGSDKARVVWSLSEFVDLFAVAEPEVEKRDPLPPPNSRPDATHRRQPTLF